MLVKGVTGVSIHNLVIQSHVSKDISWSGNNSISLLGTSFRKWLKIADCCIMKYYKQHRRVYVVLRSRQCPSCTVLCVMSTQIVCHIGHRADRLYEWKAAWNNWPLNCKSLDQRRLSFSYLMNRKPRNISDHMSSENVTHFDICSVHARTHMHTRKSSRAPRHKCIYICNYIYI